jgi:hypothetical protein
MTEIPNCDRPGFVATEPEHCHVCYQLIHPGQTYYLTVEYEVLCADCALGEGRIRVREDLAVEAKQDRLVNALAEAAVRLVDGQTPED